MLTRLPSPKTVGWPTFALLILLAPSLLLSLTITIIFDVPALPAGGFSLVLIGLIGLIFHPPRFRTDYEEFRPNKAWESLFAFFIFRKKEIRLDWYRRICLAAVAFMAASIYVTMCIKSQWSAGFAWGLLAGTALTALLEAMARRHWWDFRGEASVAAIEVVLIGITWLSLALGVTVPPVLLGGAAALGVDALGFIVFIALAMWRSEDRAVSNRAGTAATP